MRVLHFGNVANNAYLNAKLQRRAGLEADAVSNEFHILSRPEWEDADVTPPDDPYAPPQEVRGWTRPTWLLDLPSEAPPPRFRGEYWIANRVRASAQLPSLRRQRSRLARNSVGVAPPTLRDLLVARLWIENVRRVYRMPLRALFERYDVVQTYGLDPILSLLESRVPYVAFEHGTLRDIPFEDSWRGRLLSAAYREAAAVVITNADNIAAARRLGLENYQFVPHPLDQEKYSPGVSTFADEYRRKGAELVLFSPSRHDWDIKGNDQMLRGVASVLRDGRAVLLLTEWGDEVARSRGLISELGMERQVVWLPPLTKTRMVDAYRSADIVLDQFVIGTFGTVAPEAMACARPVVMALDAAHHEWCFPELPPVVAAEDAAAIDAAVSRLATDAALRDDVGRRGRDWVERHHSWQLVVRLQQEIYDRIVAQ
jgi:glycosyltransferase involved in cell wall biosynthesis